MLDFQERLRKNKPIYVKNMTKEPSATVCMSFRNNGNTQSIYIPQSGFPFKITGRIGKSMLREGGHELGQLINSGVLRLVSPKRAKEVLSDASTKEEADLQWELANNPAIAMRRAKQILKTSEGMDHPANPEMDEDGAPYVRGPRSIDPSKLPSSKPLEVLQTKLQEDNGSSSRAQYQLSLASTDPKITPRVLGVMTGWSPNTDEATLQHLKSISYALTARDLNYIMGACQRNCRTYKWAQLKFDKLS